MRIKYANGRYTEDNQSGRIIIKVFWLTSVVLSIFLTLVLKLLAHH